MEPETKETKIALDPAVNIKIRGEDMCQLELIDNLELTEEVKEQHLIPYLSALWEDLVSRSSNSAKGVRKYVFVDVMNSVFDSFIVCEPSWTHWRANLRLT